MIINPPKKKTKLAPKKPKNPERDLVKISVVKKKKETARYKRYLALFGFDDIVLNQTRGISEVIQAASQLG